MEFPGELVGVNRADDAVIPAHTITSGRYAVDVLSSLIGNRPTISGTSCDQMKPTAPRCAPRLRRQSEKFLCIAPPDR